jgi:hypothetical protein
MAAMESETAVTAALAEICGRQPISACAVEQILNKQQSPSLATEVSITQVDLAAYDRLLLNEGVSYAA